MMIELTKSTLLLFILDYFFLQSISLRFYCKICLRFFLLNVILLLLKYNVKIIGNIHLRAYTVKLKLIILFAGVITFKHFAGQYI